MASPRVLTVTGILVATFLAQAGGHLLLKEYMPIAAIGAFGFIFVALIFYYVLFIRHDAFGFLIIIYLCSHFSYADNQGGLWNLMAFGLLSLYLLSGRLKSEFNHRDVLMASLLAVFIFMNILGWVLKNPVPLVPQLQGIAVFFGFILMYRLASNLRMTEERVRLFLIVTSYMLIYQVIVALNQRYFIFSWNTPLIGSYGEAVITYGTTNARGTLLNSELLGEYAVMMLCIFVPFLSSTVVQSAVKIGTNRLVVMIISCVAIIMLTSTRAAVLLLVFVMLFYYLLLPVKIYSAVDRFSKQFKIILLLAVFVPVIGVYVGLGSLAEDLMDLSDTRFTLENVTSGEAINRGPLTEFALQRIDSESWWVGYGFGIPRSNLWAWIGADPAYFKNTLAGYHNMYLSLPMLYGWLGSVIFVLMIFLTGFRLFRISLLYRRRKEFLVVLALGFSVFWGVFLIDEFKISVLRNPNYHMLFWIWLGLSSSVMKSIRMSSAKAPAPRIDLSVKKARLV